ncbi:hypothetical protein F2981_07380 [Sinorhizobium meliloti]|nr:hypothetical protein [Sinorhizobium meliloti]
MSLSEQEILALAISSEEDDGRIYLAYADALRGKYPHSARVFEEMAEEESHHRQALIDLHVARSATASRSFGRTRARLSGAQTRLADRRDARSRRRAPKPRRWRRRRTGFTSRLRRARGTRRRASSWAIWAIAEKSHESLARRLGEEHTPVDVRDEEDETSRRQFILTYVQPGLAGLMDGSVSTSRRSSPQPSPRRIRGRPFSSVCRPPSAQAYRWFHRGGA